MNWLKVVDEFCRITEKSIVILLNPKMENLIGEPEDYKKAYDAARHAFRS